jgi:hypothetical protein
MKFTQNSSNTNSIEQSRLFLETMNATLARQSEMPKFAESLLNNFIQKMPMQTNLVEQLVNTKKVLDTIAPSVGANSMNLDVAKYNLAQERLNTDREFVMMAAQREHEKMMYERQRDERMEQASAQNMSEIVKSVFSIGKEAFLPLLMLLTQGRMPGGGIPGMPGMVPPGAVPQPQAVAQAPPQPVSRVPRPRPRPRPYNDMEEERFASIHTGTASNDDLGYGRPQTVQPQQQQVVANNTGVMRQYSAQDFANMDLNTLENLKMKGQNSRASIDSFNSALQAAISQKRLEARQSPGYEPITQYEPPQEQETTTTTTTEEIITDDQTATDLREAAVETTTTTKIQAQEPTESVGDIAE